MKLFIALIVLCCAVGCATRKTVVSADAPSMFLAESCERSITRGPDTTIVFPAGEYRPVVQDSEGVFYESPTAAIGPLGMSLGRVYVYVKKDGMHAFGGVGGVPNPLDRPLPFTSAK